MDNKTAFERLTNLKGSDSSHPSALAHILPARYIAPDRSTFKKLEGEKGQLMTLKSQCLNPGKLTTQARFIV